MPNWCAGNLRIHGNKENLLKYLEENIIFCVYDNNYEVVQEHGKVSWENDAVDILSPYNGNGWIYVSGTHRNFINFISEGNVTIYPYDCEDGNYILLFDDFMAAWNVDAGPYIEVARKYNIDIRIVAFEQGAGFDREIIIEGGEVKRNYTSHYDHYYDYIWNSAMPNLGG